MDNGVSEPLILILTSNPQSSSWSIACFQHFADVLDKYMLIERIFSYTIYKTYFI